MTVTGIEEISQSRCRIYVDGNFAFVLYKGEIRLYKIREQEEISEETYRKITEEVLVKRAKLRCMNLLKSRPYTEYQLREKLRQGEYSQEIQDTAIAYVKSFGYVDDVQYAKDYALSQTETKSRRAISESLMRKGIAKEIVEEVFADLEEDGNMSDERKLAEKWMEKKKFSPEKADYKEQQKMAAFLYRKGIPMEVIRKAIRGFID